MDVSISAKVSHVRCTSEGPYERFSCAGRVLTKRGRLKIFTLLHLKWMLSVQLGEHTCFPSRIWIYFFFFFFFHLTLFFFLLSLKLILFDRSIYESSYEYNLDVNIPGEAGTGFFSNTF